MPIIIVSAEQRDFRVSNENGDSSDSKNKVAAGEPKPIRLRPSRNQKQRSILKQPAQPQETPPPPPPETPPPAPASSNDEGRLRRMRLKRSGQMRGDLFLPEDSAPPKPDDVY